MTLNTLQAILFDMGGTLRITTPRDEADRIQGVQRILDLLGMKDPAAELTARLTSRAAAYKAWADENLVELSEPELWSRWMLPEQPASQVAPLGVKLNQLWINANGKRMMVPGARDVIIELFRGGYRLALVSNTTSSTEAVQTLRDQHISGCFETIVLSCEYGRKKPDTSILLEAVSRMGLQPEDCAYVGNDPDKDIAAARQAGFCTAVLVSKYQSRPAAAHRQNPDHTVKSLEGLLDVFPRRELQQAPEISAPIKASLSTMWAMRSFPSLNDFAEAARRLGFSKIELNHQVNSAMLEGLDLNRVSISSVHEPCPADISTETLREEDWLISATDESKRQKGVEAVQRSIDLASRVRAPLIVVHAGCVEADQGLEKDLRALIKAGKRHSDEYQRVQEQFMQHRKELAGPRLEAVKKSLRQLLDYARPTGIVLALENRYHFMDIPTLDEMGELLDLAGQEQLGFLLDTGHARVMGYMGFYPEDEWLIRYGNRVAGIHLHDVTGTSDHQAPGQGEIDFTAIAKRLPASAVRTFEVRPEATAVQLNAGIRYLISKGCVQNL